MNTNDEKTRQLEKECIELAARMYERFGCPPKSIETFAAHEKSRRGGTETRLSIHGRRTDGRQPPHVWNDVGIASDKG